MTRPDFLEMARAWLVRAQGHSSLEFEKSLADELEKTWELGIANAIDAAYAMPGAGDETDAVVEEIRKLTDKPADPRGN